MRHIAPQSDTFLCVAMQRQKTPHGDRWRQVANCGHKAPQFDNDENVAQKLQMNVFRSIKLK